MSSLLQSDKVIEMDGIISRYAKFLETVSDEERPYLQSKLLSAKLMREKFVAMRAFAKAQMLIAEMEVLVAENSFKNACEQLAKSTNEVEEKTEKPKSHKSKDSRDESKKSQTRSRKSKLPIENKENSSKSIHKSRSKEETKSKKRRGSPSHSNSKKPKLSPETSKPQKSSKSKTLTPIESSKNDFDKAMEMDDNLLSIIGEDEDTVLIEELSDKGVELPEHITELSKIRIKFEEDRFRNVKTEPSDLNTSTDNLVNNLFKDILEAKMRAMSSTSDSSTLSKSMLRVLLEQC